MLIEAQPTDHKVDVTAFVPGYSKPDHNKFAAIVFLLLDQALGEYDVEMGVGGIEIRPIFDAPANAYSLEALPAVFDRMFVRPN